MVKQFPKHFIYRTKHLFHPSASVCNQSPVLTVNTCSCPSMSQLLFTSRSSSVDGGSRTSSFLSPSSAVFPIPSSSFLTCSGTVSIHVIYVYINFERWSNSDVVTKGKTIIFPGTCYKTNKIKKSVQE